MHDECCTKSPFYSYYYSSPFSIGFGGQLTLQLLIVSLWIPSWLFRKSLSRFASSSHEQTFLWPRLVYVVGLNQFLALRVDKLALRSGEFVDPWMYVQPSRSRAALSLCRFLFSLIFYLSPTPHRPSTMVTAQNWSCLPVVVLVAPGTRKWRQRKKNAFKNGPVIVCSNAFQMMIRFRLLGSWLSLKCVIALSAKRWPQLRRGSVATRIVSEEKRRVTQVT